MGNQNSFIEKPSEKKPMLPKKKQVQSNKPNNKSPSSPSTGNGVTGAYLSVNTVVLVVEFWKQNVESLGMQQQLEVGCSILMGMMSTNKDIKTIILYKFEDHQYKIQSLSLKFLDMIGYIIRSLLITNIDLYASLVSLGTKHKNMGIKLKDYNPMLQSMHHTFKCYFGQRYSPQVQDAIDKVFNVAVRIMNGQYCNGQYFEFLESLDVCLKSKVGREFLFDYFKKKSCNEIVVFFTLLSKFKSQPIDRQRYFVAIDIVEQNIDENAANKLNILDKTAENILNKMNHSSNLTLSKADFQFSINFFIDVEREINELIIDNYWYEFSSNIKYINN